MIEFFKHLFGFCGEPHLNIWHILATPFGGYVIYKLKKYKNEKI
tara:strand:- start:568 stop:699 length:132 start_codon:yes stop_codon:yes gene_type:complete